MSSQEKVSYPDLQAQATSSLCFEKKTCRLCSSTKLYQYLDLGNTPPADQFRKLEELNLPEIWYPLRVNVCEDCGFSQLSNVVNPSVLFQYDYPYESSASKTFRDHWDAFAQEVITKLNISKGGAVVELGSNVGTLLAAFKNRGLNVFGIDPAPNIVDTANKNGIPTICDFFGTHLSKKIKKAIGQADVILGTNVFAHIDDLDDVMKAVDECLSPEGVFIFESPYFRNLIDQMLFDTIYHEHVSYISISPLVGFFAKFNMEIFSVEETNIHGGSIRVFVARKGSRQVSSEVNNLIKEEKKRGLNSKKNLIAFAEKVLENRKKLTKLVYGLLDKGKTIACISAPAKGMTLLNFCGFNNSHIKFVSERSLLKIDRYTPGSKIPIVSDEYFHKNIPDYAILLAWNLSRELFEKFRPFTSKGGKLIIPVPEPRIIDLE